MDNILQQLKDQANKSDKENHFGESTLYINKRIIELDPKYFSSYIRLTKYYLSINDLNSAHYYNDRLLKLDPNNSEGKKQKFLINPKFEFFEIKEKIKKSKSIDELKKIYKFAEKKQWWELVIEACGIGISLDPTATFFEIKRAAAQKHNYQLRDSKDSYENFLKRYPDNPYALTGLASVYRYFENYEKSIEIYLSVLSKEPNWRYAIAGIAAAYLLNGNEEMGLFYFQKSEKLLFLNELHELESNIKIQINNRKDVSVLLEKYRKICNDLNYKPLI